MPGEPGFGTPEAEAWDMLERVNLFLIQFRSDLAKGVPVEHELFLGTIRNWHRLSPEVEEMLRDRACSRRTDRGVARLAPGGAWRRAGPRRVRAGGVRPDRPPARPAGRMAVHRPEHGRPGGCNGWPRFSVPHPGWALAGPGYPGRLLASGLIVLA